MALLKFGALVTSGSGSLGGHTIQNSKGGIQLRNKPISRKQPSESQSLIRSINPILQKGWRDLTDAQRKVWNDFAAHPLSGHDIWMKFQYFPVYHGFPFYPDPSYCFLGPELYTTLFNAFNHPYETFTLNNNYISLAVNTNLFGASFGPQLAPSRIGDRYLIMIDYTKFSGSNTAFYIGSGPIGSSGTTILYPINGKHFYTLNVTVPAFALMLLTETINPASFTVPFISLRKFL